MATSEYCVVLTTTAGEAEAAALARTILAARLAACVQVQPIRSFYVWQGKSCDEPECLLYIKTRTEHYAALEELIRGHHSYDTPEILALPILAGSPPYLRFIDEATLQHS